MLLDGTIFNVLRCVVCIVDNLLTGEHEFDLRTQCGSVTLLLRMFFSFFYCRPPPAPPAHPRRVDLVLLIIVDNYNSIWVQS